MFRKTLLNTCVRLKTIVENVPNSSIKSSYLIEHSSKFVKNVRWLQTSCCFRKDDRGVIYSTVRPDDEGVDGEKSVDLDSAVRSYASMFPDENTPSQLYDGVRYDELPICLIQVTPNNTKLHIHDFKGVPTYVFRTAGVEGFKHAKKGTNIAAQATAISVSMKALALGIKNIRVKIRGLGPGRMASIKGLEMGGMNIVSITDNTPVPYGGRGPRPKKQRRI